MNRFCNICTYYSLSKNFFLCHCHSHLKLYKPWLVSLSSPCPCSCWQGSLSPESELCWPAQSPLLPQGQGRQWVCHQRPDCAAGKHDLNLLIHLSQRRLKGPSLFSIQKLNYHCSSRCTTQWVLWPKPSTRRCSCGWSPASTSSWTPSSPGSTSLESWTSLALRSLMWVMIDRKLANANPDHLKHTKSTNKKWECCGAGWKRWRD